MEIKETFRDIILDSISEGVFTVDADWRITSFNHAAETITGISHEEAVNQKCYTILKSDLCEKGCPLRETLSTGIPQIGITATILDASGHPRPISLSTAVLKDKNGKVIGGVETFRDISLVESLRKEIEKTYSFQDIISRNHRMQELFAILPDIAESPSTVLIEGESGTGKELFARAIHNLSLRRKQPFVAVNSGALPDTLLESELFGYMKGAFTDAVKDKPGRIALAEGGTLFLDEIASISPSLQVRLLRFLQEKTYEPLGATITQKANVRIIAATNQDLKQMIAQGSFRDDLYYRLNVIEILLPPLRDRLEDVPLLVDHFITRFNSIQRKEVAGISNDALSCLMSYDFPGNIRELENIIERAFVLCRQGLIEMRLLPEIIRENICIDCPKKETTSFKQLEKSFLLNALRNNNWNKVQTARQLGIHKTTLYRKLKLLGLDNLQDSSSPK